MPTRTSGLVRLLIAISVLWVLIASAFVFVEYLSRNPLHQFPSNGAPPEFYFWKWSGVDLFTPAEQQVRNFEPNILRIASLLIVPPILFWIGGCLVAWVASGFRSGN